MSLRTMPLWVNTLGPFDPSPGYGPAVSSGIWPTDAPDAAVVDVDDDVDEDDVVDAEPELEPSLDPHAPSATRPSPRPAPASILSAPRRCMSVPRSNSRPW